MRSSEASAGQNVLHCRFAVVGSGIAGLWTALHLSRYGQVALVTKTRLDESNTGYAQGGIAVALLPADSPELHKQDTLAAGDGQLIVGREAAHGRSRIIHAHGDATGAEVQRAASEAAEASPNIRILRNTMLTDLVLLHGKCVGIEALDAVSGERIRVLAGSTLLATGGSGNLYRVTTNPPVATGDGFAGAWRAGAALQDVEFVQFHPTALADASYPRFLISEAVRGEGAVLRNADGEAFMARYSPRQLDLAPRDEVSRAVLSEMKRDGADHVTLDLTPSVTPPRWSGASRGSPANSASAVCGRTDA